MSNENLKTPLSISEKFPPSQKQKKRYVSSHRKAVVTHERRHALVAYAKGKLIKISFIKDGFSTARVIFDNASTDDLKTIFAANLSGENDYRNECASDICKFDELTTVFGGQSLEIARSEADCINDQYPNDVLERLDDYLAEMNELDTDNFGRLIRQAYKERDLEKQLTQTGNPQNINSNNSQNKD